MTQIRNIGTNTRLALKNDVSFVAHFMPFVGHSSPSNIPLVCNNQPLERIRPPQRGFTLLELMITLTIAAILLGIGAPNFKTFIMNNRMVSQANDLLADFNFARGEALKRSRDVHICKSTNTTAAAPTCNATNADPWTTGWVTWVDKNGNGAFDSPDEILRITEGLSGSSNTLTTTSVPIQNEIVFTKLGILSNAGGSLNLCDERGSSTGRTLNITTSGRPSIGRNPTC